MYDKEQVPTHKVNLNNIIKTDIRGFGTGVGGFSNCATIIEAMKAIFTKDNQQTQKDELILRKKLLREIVGSEIDRIKGTTAPVLPSSWKKFEHILPTDTEEEKQAKYRHNSLVICKKPYFFRYLYPELNKKFKLYEKAYDMVSKDMFGIKFKKLLKKSDKTERERNFIRRYQKYSPLIMSDCIMNILCREFEDVNFDIQFKHTQQSCLPTFEDKYDVNPEILAKVKVAYRKYNNKKSIKLMNGLLELTEVKADDENKEISFYISDEIRQEIQNELIELKLSPQETLFYIGQLSKEYAKFNWNFAWDILGNDILECIPQGRTLVPIRDEENGEEYLGSRYKLQDISQYPLKLTINEDDEEEEFNFEF